MSVPTNYLCHNSAVLNFPPARPLRHPSFRRINDSTKTHAQRRQSGFTLVELAVVVFIIGMLAAIGITALKAQLASASISATRKKEDAIKDALVTYLAKYRRLPCPAADISGAESRTGGTPPNCTTYFGLVPYVELGLPKSAAMDGWDDFFTYAVSYATTAPLNNYNWTATLSTSITATTTTNSASAFNIGNLGSIAVYSRMPDGSQFAVANPASSTGAVVVLASNGVNGNGGYTSKGTQNVAPAAGTDESANAIPTTTLPLVAPIPVPNFFQRDYTENTGAGGSFDDIVTWLGPGDLLSPLIKDGAMQSAQSQYAAQVASIQDWIAANISGAPTCSMPAISGLPANLRVDPWGNTLNGPGSPFTYVTGGTFSSAVPATYTLTNNTPSATPTSVSPSGATMIRIYPFLNNGC